MFWERDRKPEYNIPIQHKKAGTQSGPRKSKTVMYSFDALKWSNSFHNAYK